MQEDFTLSVIAHIETDFKSKFGIPRQSGLTSSPAQIVFEESFRDKNAVRGIEGYSYLWILWGFHKLRRSKCWSPTVKPPRLGGNKRMGVFATRSPNRPNPIGLSSVKLIGLKELPGKGIVLLVEGSDLMNGTPIYDIKPYLPFTDAHPDAKGGFSDDALSYHLNVSFPEPLLSNIPEEKRRPLLEALAQDPRPAYQDQPGLPYGFPYAGFDIRFTVENDTLTVFEVTSDKDSHIK